MSKNVVVRIGPVSMAMLVVTVRKYAEKIYTRTLPVYIYIYIHMSGSHQRKWEYIYIY